VTLKQAGLCLYNVGATHFSPSKLIFAFKWDLNLIEFSETGPRALRTQIRGSILCECM